MDVGGLVQADRDVEGIVEMMLDATSDYEAPPLQMSVYFPGMLRWFLPVEAA